MKGVVFKIKNRNAFSISYYGIIDNNVSFKGRALLDIKLGDKLFYTANNGSAELVKAYIVTKIVAYRHEFEIINAGMTCEIIASGDNKLRFKEDEMLYF